MRERSFFNGYCKRSILLSNLILVILLSSCTGPASNDNDHYKDSTAVNDSTGVDDRAIEKYYSIADTVIMNSALKIEMWSDGIHIDIAGGAVKKNIAQPSNKASDPIIKITSANKVTSSNFLLLDDSTFLFTAYEQADRGVARAYAYRLTNKTLDTLHILFNAFHDYLVVNPNSKRWLTHSPTSLPDKGEKASYNLNIYEYKGEMRFIKEVPVYEKDKLFPMLYEYSDAAALEISRQYLSPTK